MDVKKAGKKEKSPKKGKKQQQDGENKEDWVALIFGENGEKVTEKGTPKSKQVSKPEDNKTEEMGPEAKEFLNDQTPFFSAKNKGAKKGGRPRKKDLDEKMDGVAKLGSNMYFYTGPGGAESPPSLHSDDEDLPVNQKKQDSEPARKSGRAGKGRNPRLEREDEVVDIPQVKVGVETGKSRFANWSLHFSFYLFFEDGLENGSANYLVLKIISGDVF